MNEKERWDSSDVMYKDETFGQCKKRWRSFLMWEHLQLANMFESGEAGRQYMKHHCNSGTTGDDKELQECSSSNYSKL